MIHANVAEMGKNIFKLLEKVAAGEIVSIECRGKTIARIVPVKSGNWRKKIKIKAKLLADPEKAFAPMTEIRGLPQAGGSEN